MPCRRTYHPNDQLQIIAEQHLADLNGTDVGAAIRFGAGTYPGLAVTWLMADTIAPVCSPELLARHGPVRSVTDLTRFSLLHDSSTEGDGSGADWPTWLAHVGAAGAPSRMGQRFSHTDLTIEAAGVWPRRGAGSCQPDQ